MTNNIARIGFCCMWLMPDGKVDPELKCKSTTLTWLRANPRLQASRLIELARHNAGALYRLVERVSQLPLDQRMVRLTSDILTGYDHPEFERHYRAPGVQELLADLYAPIGVLARAKGVRLSFHPGQFCVLSSEKHHIVTNSIRCFEMHVDIARMMGYGQSFADFKINIHISGREGPEGIKRALPRLSEEARRMITIENAEYAWGLDASLELAEDLALVFDCHHSWVASGEYIDPSDKRLDLLCESWRGVRPVMHYSISRESELPGHSVSEKPDYGQLISAGKNSSQLRAHSDYYWNDAVNEYVAGFRSRFDIMCESKAKNLASTQFAEFCRLQDRLAVPGVNSTKPMLY